LKVAFQTGTETGLRRHPDTRKEIIMSRRRATIFAFAFVLLHSTYSQAPLPSTASFDIGFSPGGTALAVVQKAIAISRAEILMACYEFTKRDIAESLEAAAHQGVKVRIVADWKASRDKYSQIRILQSAGIPVRLDRNFAIFHHKFIVIDCVTLETGSFNYTNAAIKHNAENAIVLRNVPQVAKVYAQEWGRLRLESKPQ
jgi:phosphatidylserine/phosphatidylglycerophosphate/cardiolipin synthase-like enzyme